MSSVGNGSRATITPSAPTVSRRTSSGVFNEANSTSTCSSFRNSFSTSRSGAAPTAITNLNPIVAPLASGDRGPAECLVHLVLQWLAGLPAPQVVQEELHEPLRCVFRIAGDVRRYDDVGHV